MLENPSPAELPSWLPPWADEAARRRNLEDACKPDDVPGGGYATAALCAVDGKDSPLLAAALGNAMAVSCGGPCAFDPLAPAGPTAVTAWRFDYDNRCWMQDPRRVDSCNLDSEAGKRAQAAAELLQRQEAFVDFLTLAAVNATDLRDDFSIQIAEAWDAFLASDFPASDPTGKTAHEELGRELMDGFESPEVGAKLARLPAGDPVAEWQAKFAVARWVERGVGWAVCGGAASLWLDFMSQGLSPSAPCSQPGAEHHMPPATLPGCLQGWRLRACHQGWLLRGHLPVQLHAALPALPRARHN